MLRLVERVMFEVSEETCHKVEKKSKLGNSMSNVVIHYSVHRQVIATKSNETGFGEWLVAKVVGWSKAPATPRFLGEIV